MAETMQDRALNLVGLSKAFPGPFGIGKRAALRGIDLELGAGQTLGLVGPNGSGKSTLLRLIAGLSQPSAGRLEVLGGTPAQSQVRRRLGFLPEDSPFPPELSAVAALDLFAALQGVARRERRPLARRWLERLDLDGDARRPLGRFSKGMLRRFGLAQALMHDPDLLLLDEPTAGLDAVGVGLFGELLDEARARGAAVVISSHLLSDVFDRADQLCVLVQGAVAARGAPAELVQGARRVRLELDGADDDLLRSIDDLAQRSGARVVHRGPGGETLLEIYRAHGGAR